MDALKEEIDKQQTLFNDLRAQKADAATLDEAKKRLADLKKQLGQSKAAAGAGKKRAQFAMDVDEAGQETETEAEDEPDFPDVKLDELLEGFDEMTLNENDVAAVVV